MGRRKRGKVKQVKGKRENGIKGGHVGKGSAREDNGRKV